jgi:hypothetical protein
MMQAIAVNLPTYAIAVIAHIAANYLTFFLHKEMKSKRQHLHFDSHLGKKDGVALQSNHIRPQSI